MSTRKGGAAKTGQRYQNASAFKVDMHGESRQARLAKALPLSRLCDRCREILEWKKKYGKYKPLTVPRKCTGCSQKTVRQAYYLLCHDCAQKRQVCAKCTKNPASNG